MKSVLFLLSACAAIVVLASPHNIHVARRHAIAARAPVAIPDDVPLESRQSNKRRCKNRSSSSVTLATTPDGKVLPKTPTPNILPTTTPRPTTTSTTPVDRPTPTPIPTTTQSNSGFMSGVQTGDGTYYDVGLGACGTTNSNSEAVVAVSWALFDVYPGYNKVNPNTNPICGKRIRATYQGKSVTVTVVDRCADQTCLVGNLDFSPTAFAQLASLGVGRLKGVTWTWA